MQGPRSDRRPVAGQVLERSLATGLAIGLALSFLLVGPASFAAATGPSSPADGSHPSLYSWTNGVVSLGFGGEEPSFWISSVQDGRVNVSVSALALAEVNPSGEVVAIASLTQTTSAWALNGSQVGSGVEVVLSGSAEVSTAHFAWNVSELPEPPEGGFGPVSVTLTFHLVPSSSSSAWSVKFDVAEQGWPWVSSVDHLGLALKVQAASATEIEPGSSGDGVTEGSNSTGTPVASLTWGPTANVTTTGGATAEAQVLSTVVASGDQQSSGVRLLFGGVAGGYASLLYDPTVVLHAGAFSAPLLVAWLFTPEVLGALLVGTLLVALLAGAAWKARAHPSEDHLASARPLLPVPKGEASALHCRRCGARLQVPAGAGVRVLTCLVCSRI